MRCSALGLAVSAALVASSARAARPMFEPTDLELEDSGTVEIDTQVGLLRGGSSAVRVVVPDFEIDVGLARGIELDIDATYAIEGPDSGSFTLDHAAPDNVWTAGKVGLFDLRDEEHGAAWAGGVQLGPRFPTARGAHGVGGEALLLLGHVWPGQHAVMNLGWIVDTKGAGSDARPSGLEGGLSVDVDLDRAHRWSLLGQVAAVRYLSDDPHQLHASAGAAYSVTDALDVSAVALIGLLPGGDRYGALLGFSPKFHLW